MTTKIDGDAWVIVYLAGGMHTGWQDKVIEACEHKRIQFLDPRSSGLTDEDDYTAWDLWAVQQSDYVFGYLAKDNPSGIGLAVEFGYGIGSGRELIFIEDEDDDRTRKFGMLRAISTHNFVGFDKGLDWFKKRMQEHVK